MSDSILECYRHFKLKGDLDQWHQHVLDLMVQEVELHHSSSTDFSYYDWWMERAMHFNHLAAVANILDHVDVPREGLTLKQRLAIYTLMRRRE